MVLSLRPPLTAEGVRYVRKKSRKVTTTAGTRDHPDEHTLAEEQLSPCTSHSDHGLQVTTPSSLAHSLGNLSAEQPVVVNGQSSEIPCQQDGPEMLYARMADQGSPDTHAEQSSRTYYLGDSFSLAYIVKTVCRPSGTGEPDSGMVHHYIPATVTDGPVRTQVEDPPSVRDASITPPKEISDELVGIFFDCFHPAFPVFDRGVFAARYERGEMSLLVLQTIYMLAFTVCNEELVIRAGYRDRPTARRTHYLRAKALYDADGLNDRVILTAVLFLLSFWWAGPEDQKDTWHWLGAALSLAQTLGMHRSYVLFHWIHIT